MEERKGEGVQTEGREKSVKYRRREEKREGKDGGIQKEKGEKKMG